MMPLPKATVQRRSFLPVRHEATNNSQNFPYIHFGSTKLKFVTQSRDGKTEEVRWDEASLYAH